MPPQVRIAKDRGLVHKVADAKLRTLHTLDKILKAYLLYTNLLPEKVFTFFFSFDNMKVDLSCHMLQLLRKL